MKKNRLDKIIDIITQNEVETQDELISYLKEAGYTVTQATVSRDIRELKLVKVNNFRVIDHSENNRRQYTSDDTSAYNENRENRYKSSSEKAEKSFDDFKPERNFLRLTAVLFGLHLSVLLLVEKLRNAPCGRKAYKLYYTSPNDYLVNNLLKIQTTIII